MRPKVSIMIPTYNQVSVVGDALKSALDQDYPNLEIVVSDDGSKDGTQEVLRSHESDPRVKVHVNPVNLGRVANYRHTLYERATGDWVLNLDGDDWLDNPQAISSLMDALERENSGDVVAVLGATKVTYPNTEHFHSHAALGLVSGFDFFLQAAKARFFHSSTLYNRKAAMALDFYRHDILSTDQESLLKLFITGNLILCDHCVSVWRRTDLTESSTLDLSKHFANLQRIEGPYAFGLSRGKSLYTMDEWKTTMMREFLLFVAIRTSVSRSYRSLLSVVVKVWLRHPVPAVVPLFRLLWVALFLKFPALEHQLRNLFWRWFRGRVVPHEKY